MLTSHLYLQYHVNKKEMKENKINKWMSSSGDVIQWKCQPIGVGGRGLTNRQHANLAVNMNETSKVKLYDHHPWYRYINSSFNFSQ